MAIPGFNDPHGDMHGHFEKWVYEQLCIPVLGPITGWHIILIVVVAIGRLFPFLNAALGLWPHTTVVVSANSSFLEPRQQ